MNTGSSKKHKRSGSVIVPSGSGVVVKPRKKKTKASSHGKFQVKLKAPKERKNIDQVNALTFFEVPATAVVTLLNTYTAGTGPNNAVGRRVVNKSVHVRMTVSSDGTGLAANGGIYGTTCRVLVVYDRQPTGAVPNTTNILQDTTALGSALMNLGNSDRYSILMDEKFVLGPVYCAATAGTPNVISEPGVYNVDRYVKVGLQSVANGSFTGAIGGILEGAIWLVAMSDQGGAGIRPKIVSMATRIRFTDD